MTTLPTIILILNFLINTFTFATAWGPAFGTTSSTYHYSQSYTHNPYNTSPGRFGKTYLMECYFGAGLQPLTKTNPQYNTPFPLNLILNQVGIGINIDWYGYQCRIWAHRGECSCGESCKSLGSCCFDFLWSKFHQNIKSISTNVKNYVKSVQNSTKGQSCLPMFRYLPEMSLWSGNNYIMVDTCLPEADKTDIDGCLNTTSVGETNKPVYGKDGYLYKNSHCARCNNILQYRYDFMRFSCELTEPHHDYPPRSLLEMAPFHQVLKHFPWCKLIPRKDFRDTILKCEPNECSRTDLMFCRIFKGNFFNGRDTTESTKNVFCEKCLSSQTLRDGSVRKPCWPKPDGWSLVINLNSGTPNSQCGQNEVKMADGSCTAIQCGHGQRLVQGQCQKICQPGFTFSTAENECQPLSCRKEFDRKSNGQCQCLTPKFINTTGYCQSCEEGFKH